MAKVIIENYKIKNIHGEREQLFHMEIEIPESVAMEIITSGSNGWDNIEFPVRKRNSACTLTIVDDNGNIIGGIQNL